MIECHAEPLEVMASLVIHERGFASGAHREPMLLILVEPAKLFGVEPLVRAIAKYAHHAAVWQYDPDTTRRLSPYTAPIAPPPRSGAGPTNGAGNGLAGPSQPRARTVASAAPSFVSWVGMPRAAAPQPAPAPKLRLAGTTSPATLTPAANNEPAQPPAVKPALTEAEMAMLLGDDTRGEHTRLPARGSP